MRFQHWGLINYVHAKKFINPGGPPVFKLHFLGGSWGCLIQRVLLILTWHYKKLLWVKHLSWIHLGGEQSRSQGGFLIPTSSRQASSDAEPHVTPPRHPKSPRRHWQNCLRCCSAYVPRESVTFWPGPGQWFAAAPHLADQNVEASQHEGRWASLPQNLGILGMFLSHFWWLYTWHWECWMVENLITYSYD